MSGRQNHLRMNNRSSTFKFVAGSSGFFLDDGRHPRELPRYRGWFFRQYPLMECGFLPTTFRLSFI